MHVAGHVGNDVQTVRVARNGGGQVQTGKIGSFDFQVLLINLVTSYALLQVTRPISLFCLDSTSRTHWAVPISAAPVAHGLRCSFTQTLYHAMPYTPLPDTSNLFVFLAHLGCSHLFKFAGEKESGAQHTWETLCWNHMFLYARARLARALKRLRMATVSPHFISLGLCLFFRVFYLFFLGGRSRTRSCTS